MCPAASALGDELKCDVRRIVIRAERRRIGDHITGRLCIRWHHPGSGSKAAPYFSLWAPLAPTNVYSAGGGSILLNTVRSDTIAAINSTATAGCVLNPDGFCYTPNDRGR